MDVTINLYDHENKKNIELKRAITTTGQIEFYIDGAYKTKKEYKEYVTDILEFPSNSADNILFKQGRLESSAYIKGGHELTTFLEKLSGSYEHKKEYEEILTKNLSNEKVSFNLSKEISDIKKQKKKLEQMDGYIADSKDLLKEREDISDKIDQAKILAYQIELETLKDKATELNKAIDHSLKQKER